MAFRSDLISTAGLRADGRRANEIRSTRCYLGGASAEIDGSCLFELGQTRVLASVLGPREASGPPRGTGGSVSVQLRLAAFSGTERKQRHSGDRKVVEARTALERTLAAAVELALYPRAQIDVVLEVLQADGGWMAACVNAAGLALMDAGVCMRDTLVACSAGFVEGSAVLDLNYVERTGGAPEMTVAMLANANKVVLAQMDSKLPLDAFGELLQAGLEGCQVVYQALEHKVREHTAAMLAASADAS